MQIAIAEAKAHLAALIRRAEAGEEIELTRHGRPVARIVAARPQATTGLVGCMKGAFPAPDPHAGDAEAAALLGAGRIWPE